MSWSFQDQMVGNAPKLAKSYQISFCYELRNVREKLKPHNSRTFNDLLTDLSVTLLAKEQVTRSFCFRFPQKKK